MKLLLSCDDYCYKSGNNYFLSDKSYLLASRYLKVFDGVKMALRTKEVTLAEIPSNCHKLVDERIEIHEMPFFQGPAQFSKVIISAVKAAKESLQNCDAAILRLPSPVAFIVWRKLRHTNIPFATEIVFDCKDASNSGNFQSKVLWCILHAWQVKACAEAEGVSCVTSEYLQRRYHPTKNGAFVSNYSSAEIVPAFFYRARTYPNKKILSIAHVANQVAFNSRKGHNELIKAISLLKKDGIVIDVKFIGEDYFDGFEKLRHFATELGVEDQIQFTGYLSSKQMRETLIDSDLAVLPTKSEGLPRVIIEAMAMGIPCVTTPVSGNPELIDKQFLVNYDDVIGLKDRIRDLVIDKNLYEEQSKTNFERSKEYSSLVLNPRRYEFYKKLYELAKSRKENIK